MARPSLHDLVSSTGELATLPGTVIRLLELLEDTATSADKVQDILESDPAMTANVLKLANSAYYGARRTIGSVRDALVLLGNRAVTTLAFATGMAPVLRRDLVAYSLHRDAYWRHSVTAAAAASLAADLAGDGRWRAQAFTGGLVHDVGKLVIDTHLLAERAALPLAPGGGDVRRAERDRLGYDHGEVGAALTDAWGFPDVLVAAVGRPHETGLADDPVARAVAVGDVVAVALQEAPDAPWTPAVRARLARLDAEPEDYEQLRLDLAEDLDDTLTAAATPAVCPA